MLSKEKARFKSVLDKTNNQIIKDATLKRKQNHTLGILSSLIIKRMTLATLLICRSIELIADFKNSWLMVSIKSVAAIKTTIKIIFCFILALINNNKVIFYNA